MKNLYTINSKIEVFPENRLRIKNSKSKLSENYTIIAKVSDDISKYYAKFIYKEYGVFLNPPEFGAHVTISDNRKSINLEKHKQYLKEINNRKIKIKCSCEPYLHWEFYSILVFSEELTAIQQHLGLKANPLHITIGKIADKSKLPSLLTTNLF